MISACDSARDLPADWDAATGDNPYLKRDFLAFIESYDRCGQRYYHIRAADGRLDTVFMTLQRRNYNLTMFTDRDLHLTMTFVYLPLSVARPGFVFGRYQDKALRFIRGLPGNKLILNLPPGHYSGFATGRTCYRCELRLRWDSLDRYLDAMRASYRRRWRRALAASDVLRMRFLAGPDEFDGKLYDLYRQVVARSRLVIEVLPIEFFRKSDFRTFVLEDESGPQGFAQLLPNGSELIFEFVGVNYATAQGYDSYHRMLVEIVRYGIENGFQTIDFGQTADESKLKLGCDYIDLRAALHMANPLLMTAARLGARRVEYQPLTTQFRVFKVPGT
ncbi:MAG: GNAT family N-acetyltransferase [Bifidobacteriaceae bacterium]|jgi:hypothetical protein|nr:GNAT family N-acetyltransferase [Bifidobacteriaceae bacterium]